MFFAHNSTLAAPFGASMAGICIILTRAMMHHAKRHMYMLCSGVVFVNKNSRPPIPGSLPGSPPGTRHPDRYPAPGLARGTGVEGVWKKLRESSPF